MMMHCKCYVIEEVLVDLLTVFGLNIQFWLRGFWEEAQ